MPLKIASEWLNACSGCEIAILNMGVTLLELLPEVHFVHMPLLMDHKHRGQLGDKDKIHIPEADVGLLSGGIRNQENMHVAKEMRKKCNVLIALGTCATHGGIPAMINSFSNEGLMERCYKTPSKDAKTKIPSDGIPPLLDRCYALDEQIRVDLYLPGCPPHPDHINAALVSFLNDTQLELPFRSVCDACPAIRTGKGDISNLKRFVCTPEFNSDQPLDSMRCFLEQGYLCCGPVTRAGCEGAEKGAPCCISARVPCRGCYGPVKQNGNQLLDMLNALASNGIDFSSLPDSQGLLRFSGAHNRLVSKKGNI